MLAVVVWSWNASCAHGVKFVTRLVGSRMRAGGVDGQLQQWVRFSGVLFRNEFSSFEEGLHEEELVRG